MQNIKHPTASNIAEIAAISTPRRIPPVVFFFFFCVVAMMCAKLQIIDAMKKVLKGVFV
jgi:hypothetical protein